MKASCFWIFAAVALSSCALSSCVLPDGSEPSDDDDSEPGDDDDTAESAGFEVSATVHEGTCEAEDDPYLSAIDFDLDMSGDVQFDVYYRAVGIGQPWFSGPIVSGINNTPLLSENGIYCPGGGQGFSYAVIERRFESENDDPSGITTRVIDGSCDATVDPYLESTGLVLNITGRVQYDTYFRLAQFNQPWFAGTITSGINNTPLLSENGVFCPGGEQGFDFKIIERSFGGGEAGSSLTTEVHAGSCDSVADAYLSPTNFDLDRSGDRHYAAYYRSSLPGQPWFLGPIDSGVNNTPLLSENGVFCPGNDQGFNYSILEMSFSQE